MRRHAFALCAVFFLSSCASYAPPATPSGQIEMSYAQPAGSVKAQLVNFWLNKGFGVANDSDFQIVFDKQAGPGMTFAQAMLTCAYCPPPRLRPKFTFVELEGHTRVVASAAMLTNANSIKEQEQPLQNAEVDADLLASLQAVPGGVAPAGMTMAAVAAPPRRQPAQYPLAR